MKKKKKNPLVKKKSNALMAAIGGNQGVNPQLTIGKRPSYKTPSSNTYS